MKTSLKIVSVIIVVLVTSVWGLFWYHDYSAVRNASSMVEYLKAYYQSNRRYPTQEEFYQRYHRYQSVDSEYRYSFNPAEPGHFALQYPMWAIRRFAIGERRISEFTGTTYAYQLTSCDVGGACYEWETKR